MNAKQRSETQISSVHYIESPRLESHPVQHQHVVGTAVGMGRDYDDLDPHNPQDNLLVRQVFSEANTIRYIRMGMCGKWLEPTPWQSKVAARNPHIYSTTNRK